MNKLPEESTNQELRTQGCLHLPTGVPKNLLDGFESEIHELASFHLKRLGLRQEAEDALTDLLQHGGQFRRLLFPHLKNLSSVREIALTVIDGIQRSGVMAASCFERASVHWLLKADVPGERKYLLPMHQDYNTPCHQAWRAWVPLRAASQANGTMRYVPGSHDEGFIDHDTSNPELPTVPRDKYVEKSVQILELPAGDAFLFHPLLVHGSVAATRPVMKYSIIVNFWDLDTLADPDDADDPITARLAMGRMRDQVRGDRDPIRPAKGG